MSHILGCHEVVKTDFVSAQNCVLVDSQGRRYLDFESGIWSAGLGHNHPRIDQVIQSQLEKVIHLGTRYPNAIAEAAAVDVLDIIGIEQGKCTFLSSGSEAVEFGVQAARRITQKPQLLTFTSAYLAAYGSAGNKGEDEWLTLDWLTVACDGVSDCLAEVPFDSIGAFVFEPGGSGSGFVKFPPKGLVQKIAERVKGSGGLLVVNEVTTGMGRTGKWFGFQHYDLQPDIVALGKGLGNGYPVSAVAMKADCAEKLVESGFHYAQSHQNDPLGCAVAREVIATLMQGNWIEIGDSNGDYFLAGLKALKDKYAVVKEARGRGMLLALELHPNAPISADQAYLALLEKGFLVGYYSAGNILRFDPSLTIDRADIDRLLACLDAVLADVG
jgi:acetylornithine aminotransferase